MSSELAEDRKIAAEFMAEKEMEYRKAPTISGTIEAKIKESEKEINEAYGKIGVFKKREEDLKIAELGVKHVQAESKTTRDLLDTVRAMGAKMEKAT
ncbi:hypothetical protein G6011_05599 [Alternaria panax]|uniref:Uncharacterized protein n=1 Tax=Alternaria panax TaxID=48097 RepID=A0AAD4FF20_9PLEO|nr:hypothetical protein G6011_05599 [Alternaria panax]